MNYKKFSADQIFTGSDLLTDQSVLITSNDGTILDMVAPEDAGDDIQYLSGILSPGFVNAHCHLELSHMKGLIPEHTGLPDFILKIVNERHFPEEQILDGIAKAEAEMLTNGIVAVGDICNNTLTIPQKVLGNMAYHNFIEVSGWKPEIAVARFEHSKTVLAAFVAGLESAQNKNQRSISASNIHHSSLSPHAPYSVSNELWQQLMPYFEGNTVTIHNQETQAENQLFGDGTGNFISMYAAMNINQTHFVPTGLTSLQSYFHQLNTAKNLLLVHNTETNAQDIFFANAAQGENKQSLYWCLCVNANLYIENKLPPIELLSRYHVNMVIGTDSLASNHSLSILDELKTISKHFPQIPLEELLQWATLNGAKALQLDHQFGSFEKGKKPGMILIQGIEEDQLLNHTTVNIIR
ncbi:MAG: amidohydrolase [Sphingobacteriia bacterium]|nr:MAG: amidohydrolase [Sphingobacteriia bacterium]TAG30793.1 MAG: amidohydrolase [Sphingobacteriia bacterium]